MNVNILLTICILLQLVSCTNVKTSTKLDHNVCSPLAEKNCNIFKNENHIPMNISNIKIDLVLKQKETSKDSNSETISIKIFDEKILINKQYSGFKAPENKKVEKKLNKDKKQQIFNFIQEHKLNVNIEEQKKIEGIGIEGYLRFEIYQPDTTAILINGKTNIWGTDDYVKKTWGKKYVESRTNIENIGYFGKARSFVHFIECL